MLGRLRVIVVGGSLGGLTAGLTLRDIGCDVTVLERSRTPLESRGAGIVLHPATVRYFIDNQVLALGEVSTQADSLRYVNREGAVVHEQPCNYRFTSYYTLHRGLLSAMDPERYEMGSRLQTSLKRAPRSRLFPETGPIGAAICSSQPTASVRRHAASCCRV
jgi:2,6-dihydroxypyridine 3-monooxygenase